MNYNNSMGLSQIIMSEKPSQWLNFGWALATLIGFTVPPIGFVLLLVLFWKMLVIHFWRWDITLDSLMEVKGVLNVTTDEVLLFRVKDIRLYQPFLYRLVGLSRLYIVTSDKYRPVIILDGIRDGASKRVMFKGMVERHRKNQGVREFDFR